MALWQSNSAPGRKPRAMWAKPMARNPVALIIPCHRVLAAGGKVGGFSAPGGSAAQKRMLALEGVHLDPPPPAQQSFRF
jgi:methylated-DNA-[protein]-cysteine S-methyltransferase